MAIRPEAAAAPATVGGEFGPKPLEFAPGRWAERLNREPGDLPATKTQCPRVEDEQERVMNTVQSTARPATATQSRTLQLGLAGFLGLVIVGVVGFAPMAVAHNAAHDFRHSLAFPCH